jgi:hypothetical protein
MDPTMGETATIGNALDVAASFQAVAEADANTTVVPATNYPVGKVDFNKPFIVFDSYDDTDVHTNARVLAVLAGNAYPVVVISTDQNGDEVVHQFDTDGDALDIDLKAENSVIGPITKYVLIERNGRSFDTEVYDSEEEARNDADTDNFHAIVPLVIPADAEALVLGGSFEGESFESGIEDEEQIDGDLEETTAITTNSDALPEGSVRVNGTVYAAGDKVRVYRGGFGERNVTVIKTRTTDPWKSLYVQADDGTGPYWALNKNVRWKVQN